MQLRISIVEDDQLTRETLVKVINSSPQYECIAAYGSAEEALRVGPVLTAHPVFPQGINVECARIVAGEIELVVWERGSGYTLACGTGAAATAALAWAKGLLPEGPTRVHLPGGPLTVWREGDMLMQRGPARLVFSGAV